MTILFIVSFVLFFAFMYFQLHVLDNRLTKLWCAKIYTYFYDFDIYLNYKAFKDAKNEGVIINPKEEDFISSNKSYPNKYSDEVVYEFYKVMFDDLTK